MSLYIDLSVNDDRIETVVVTRIQSGKPAHRYRWTYYRHPLNVHSSPIAFGEVLHREAEGAAKLAALVLADVSSGVSV